MDLSTTYCGLKLRSPLVPSAGPLCEDVDQIRRMEDAGAAAVVLHSLFEEQLKLERFELHRHLTEGTESYPEALTYFPQSRQFQWGPEEYLEHIRRAKRAVKIPVIASLNGASPGGWTGFARMIEEAGADALELNIYSIPSDPEITGEQIEEELLAIVASVRKNIRIPVAVKLSPFYSNFANVARKLDDAGANALVLFNRFYQPDIDLEMLEVRPNVLLSTPQALRLPLTWIGILHGRIQADLAATSGIHEAADVLKVVMAGANIAMLCSVLLKRQIGYIRVIEENLTRWMESHEYESVQQMRGSMSQLHCEDPSTFERANYMQAISRFRFRNG